MNAFLSGRIDSHRDHHVRRALYPLSKLAEESDVTIMIVCHLNKSAYGDVSSHRIGGSIAFVGAVRAALLVAADPADKDKRVLAVMKANLGPKAQALRFHLEHDDEFGVARIVWDGFSDHSAAELLKPPHGERIHQALDMAEVFLSDVLATGTMPAEDVRAQALEFGISEPTLHRAKRSLGVRSKRIGFGKGSQVVWALHEGEASPESDAP